ncbi:MAG: FecR domain-containing protein [Candidatus Eremiobacteraeota bacterium]|nr:FecR domain-containing protein [Candidatus Eremiobacteraeota bacterium]
MRARSFWPAAAMVAIALGFAVPAVRGADEKLLQNVRGDVTYIAYPSGAAHPVAVAASLPLNDDDVAATGSASMGAIVLPDSSRIIMASNTTVKLDTFNATDNSGHFVVANGKLRFRVDHPSGAKANYTFTTPTGQIGVRGTEGDISVDALDGVRVNVYHLSDASLPVTVNMIDGQTFSIPAGQKIWMRWQSGKLVGKVLPLTKAEVDRFSELGAPATIDGGLAPAATPAP